MIELASLRAAAAPIARDLVGVAGGGCIAAGVGMLSVPAGVIVAGIQMVAVAWLLARRG